MGYLGIDVGGTNLVIGIFDEDINLLHKHVYHTKMIKNNYFQGLVSLIESLNIKDLQGIGIGVPGSVTKDGYVISLTNLEFNEHNLKRQMEDYFKIPVIIGNDADMAAFGEYNYNKLEKNKVYCVITLGTGVGSGIIINGKLLIGNRGLAGEIGHLQIDRKKRFHCNCQGTGCCETITSAIGFSNLYRYYKKYYPDSILHKHYRINSRLIMEAAVKNDPLAKRIKNEVIYHLALLCKEVSYIIDVDHFIFGGGISKNPNLVKMIKNRYLKMVNHEFNSTEFSKAILEDDAGIYGAAYYIKERKEESYESN